MLHFHIVKQFVAHYLPQIQNFLYIPVYEIFKKIVRALSIYFEKLNLNFTGKMYQEHPISNREIVQKI